MICKDSVGITGVVTLCGDTIHGADGAALTADQIKSFERIDLIRKTIADKTQYVVARIGAEPCEPCVYREKPRRDWEQRHGPKHRKAMRKGFR